MGLACFVGGCFCCNITLFSRFLSAVLRPRAFVLDFVTIFMVFGSRGQGFLFFLKLAAIRAACAASLLFDIINLFTIVFAILLFT